MSSTQVGLQLRKVEILSLISTFHISYNFLKFKYILKKCAKSGKEIIRLLNPKNGISRLCNPQKYDEDHC